MSVRVLIIEDSAPMRSLLKRRLEQIGCQVVGEASDTAAGLDQFRALRPELITLDLVMPEGNGPNTKELFRAIRQEAPEVAVVVISARPKTAERAEFMREGAMAYFEKPFISSELLLQKITQIFPELKPNHSKGPTRRL